MQTPRIVAIAAALAVLLSASAPAAATKNSHKHPKREPVAINAGDAVIEKVSATSITLKMAKSEQTFAISGSTDIRIAGVKAAASKLAKGMHADVHESALHPGTADSISVDNPSVSAGRARK